MRFTYTHWLFLFFGIASCLFSFFDLPGGAIVTRTLAILSITLEYYKYRKFKNIWFYLGIVASIIGEGYLILGFEHHIRMVIITYISYAWILLLMIREGSGKLKIRLRGAKLPSILVSALLLNYLLFNVVGLITPGLKENVNLAYGFVVSFMVLLVYISLVYMSANTAFKYLWLLFFTVSVFISSIITSTEAFFYQSMWLEQIGHITVIASHLFILNFLLASNKELSI